MMMKKQLLAALALASVIAAPAMSETKQTFTADQQAEIGKIAEDYFTAHPEKMGEAISIYLANHPEFLVAASDNLRQNQQAAAQKVKEMQEAAKQQK